MFYLLSVQGPEVAAVAAVAALTALTALTAAALTPAVAAYISLYHYLVYLQNWEHSRY
jgi:hypothetical protein